MPILNVPQLRAMLKRLGPDALSDAMEPALMRVLSLVEAKAVELAPVDTGNLASSTVIQIESATAKLVRGSIAFATPYASTQHEGVDWRTGSELKPGPRTARAPGNELGRPGAKFLERALRGADRYAPKAIAELLRDAWVRL